MKSCLMAMLLLAVSAVDAMETPAIQRGVDAYTRGDWSRAVLYLEGNLHEAKNNREVMLILGLAYAKLSGPSLDSSSVHSFHKARWIFQSLAEIQDSLGVLAALDLARLACVESQGHSNALFQIAEKAIQKQLKGSISSTEVEKLQKALIYLEFVRFQKAWKTIVNPDGGPDGMGPMAKKGKGAEDSSKAPEKTIKTSEKVLKGKHIQDKGTPAPGRGNLELPDWKGDVGPLTKDQAVNLIGQASLKILYPAKAPKP